MLRDWSLLVTIAFACGLIVTPIVVPAEEEGGGKGECQARHETTDECAHGHMKKDGKEDPKKASAVTEKTAAGHAPESAGAHDDDEGMEEGSH